MKTPRLAFFIPSLRGGGAERVILRLAAGFADRGFSVDLVVSKAEGSYLTQVPANIHVVDLGHRGVLRSLPALIAYLKRARPGALLSGMEHVNLIAIWAKLLARSGTRVVIGIHNTESQAADGSAIKRHAVRALLLWFIRYADGIVAVSKGVADDYARFMGLPRAAVRVIYNPAIAPEISRLGHEAPQHPWYTEKSSPVIVSVGRLTIAKNHRMLVQAMAAVHAQTGARLLILGEGPERERLAAQIRRAGLEQVIDMPGFKDNPFSFMKCADAFVLCSAWEGLPTVLVEAMSLGTPVVSTDCPSGPAEILEGGKWGRLVAPGDSDALASALIETLMKPQRDSAIARAHDFTVDKIIGDYAEALAVSL